MDVNIGTINITPIPDDRNDAVCEVITECLGSNAIVTDTSIEITELYGDIEPALKKLQENLEAYGVYILKDSRVNVYADNDEESGGWIYKDRWHWITKDEVTIRDAGINELYTELARRGVWRKAGSTKNNTGWAEIRCDFFNEEDMCWRIDAWKTTNDNEEGKVIALVDELTGRVFYIDPLARVDEMAQEVIRNKVEDILKNKILVKVNKQTKAVFLTLKTPYGEMSADAETAEEYGKDAMYIGMQYSDNPDSKVDLVAAKVNVENDYMNLLAWPSPWDCDPQLDSIITKDEIAEYLSYINQAPDNTTCPSGQAKLEKEGM